MAQTLTTPVVASHGVHNAMDADIMFRVHVARSLHRFNAKDWGESKDKELNDSDPKNAMGVYTIPKGEQQVTIWIKADDYQGMDGIDYVRTILYPSEY